MRNRLLLVAKEVDLRARFARGLQSAGYAVELAGDGKRAIGLARDNNFHAVIVAPEPTPASLAMTQQLCGRVSGRIIVLAQGPDEIAHLRHLLPQAGAFFLKTSNEGAVIARVGEMTDLTDN